MIKIPESKIPAQNKDIFDFLLNAIATELYFRTGETKTNGLGETTLSYEILAANYLASKNIIVNHSDNPEDYRLQDNVLRQEVA
ncbi:MAG: hypothetical protein LBQ59_03800 [Candidatus Peribacteria bacterium]|nr:hypothetical protein [Candidatus Peribacteria bacterium]